MFLLRVIKDTTTSVMTLRGTEIIAGWLSGFGALKFVKWYTEVKVSCDNKIRIREDTNPPQIIAASVKLK
jgi:hypothetical protein